MADTDAQHKKLAFSILEYLHNYSSTAGADIAESLEVAIQCISDSFGVSLSNEESKTQFSIQPATLPAVFALGLARKEQIENALAAANVSNTTPAPATTPTPVSQSEIVDLEKKFTEYCRLLTEKGYFAGSAEGTSEYQTRHDKARAKFFEKYNQTQAQPSSPVVPTPTSPPVQDPAEKIKRAEEYKTIGNQKLSAHQYQEAVDNYTKAIEYDSTNAIYYANRAAGYSHLNKHQLAIDDCNQAISRNPNYGKAYSRLGLANFSLGKYPEAVTNYKKALEMDPNNATIKQSLESAEKKVREAANPPAAGGAPGFPAGLADIVNNPLFQNLAQSMSGGAGANAAGAAAGNAAATTGAAGGDAAGMPDVSQLLNNPALLNMAQNVMSQPGFSDMLNNPAMMNMAQSFMQNPEALSGILQGVFGNQGAPGAGGTQ